MNIDQLKGKTIGAAVSGGLDSCTMTRWLVNHDVKVVCFSADLAQPDEKNINDVRHRMLASGADEAIIVDAKDALAEAGLKPCLNFHSRPLVAIWLRKTLRSVNLNICFP